MAGPADHDLFDRIYLRMGCGEGAEESVVEGGEGGLEEAHAHSDSCFETCDKSRAVPCSAAVMHRCGERERVRFMNSVVI